jgi:omega-6 fatty acid desaturase (delta-12 desaturase)
VITQTKQKTISTNEKPIPSWQLSLAQYRIPNLKHSLWQVANTLIPFIFIWYLMYTSLSHSYWLTLALAPIAAGFQLRLFIIFHDCSHGAFFKNRKFNDWLGSLCGVICLTSYHHWRHSHAIHHATNGNLDRRREGSILPMTMQKYLQGNGDILTLTVREYKQLSVWERLAYRIYREPFFMLVLVPSLLFVVFQRFASPSATKRARYGVYWTNLGIFTVIVVLSLLIGFQAFLLVELPIVILSSTTGVWLFYVQHQFEGTYWQQEDGWNFIEAALQGSSYYKLPTVLQWFTGNIGFHHIHHLNPRIPNYNLQKCFDDNLFFRKTKAITLISGLRSLFFRLWDEEQQKMIGFRTFRALNQKPSKD